MFVCYNAKMRGFPNAMVEYLAKLGPSAFVTTLHAINSGILKMARVSMLPPLGFVYRGLSGVALPRDLTVPNAQGITAGVELGFCSTTMNKAVAMQYVGEGINPVIFEIRVGQVNHGAILDEISQFPGEAEILFPPLCNLELEGEPRVQNHNGKHVTVIPFSICVNTHARTIDQLVEARKELQIQMLENFIDESRRMLDAVLDETRMIGSSRHKIDAEDAKQLRDVRLRIRSMDSWIASDGAPVKQAIRLDCSTPFKPALPENTKLTNKFCPRSPKREACVARRSQDSTGGDNDDGVCRDASRILSWLPPRDTVDELESDKKDAAGGENDDGVRSDLSRILAWLPPKDTVDEPKSDDVPKIQTAGAVVAAMVGLKKATAATDAVARGAHVLINDMRALLKAAKTEDADLYNDGLFYKTSLIESVQSYGNVRRRLMLLQRMQTWYEPQTWIKFLKPREDTYLFDDRVVWARTMVRERTLIDHAVRLLAAALCLRSLPSW
jgi:hypothetical protein